MYAFLNVLPGKYTVSVAKAGNFAGFPQKNIAIEANQQVRVDITLQPADRFNTDHGYRRAAAAANRDRRGQQRNQPDANSLNCRSPPAGGRNFQALYTLIPGGTAVAEQNSTASNPSRSMSVNVNGS